MTLPNVCIPRIPPRAEEMLSKGLERAHIALIKSNIWPNGSKLGVYMSGATAKQRRDTQEVMAEVSSFANLDFATVSSAAGAEIRITYASNQGAWSYIGTDALRISKTRSTMNLGFVQGGTYRHEFGHAIGAIHEHQSPFGGIKWNKQQVIKDLSGPPNNWDRQTIETNMFQAYNKDQLNGTQFDPRSIMLYQIPASWTLDGFQSRGNSEWSDQDKAWLATQYPGRFNPVEPDEPTKPEKEPTLQVAEVVTYADDIGVPGEIDLFTFKQSRNELREVRIETLGDTPVVLRLFGPDEKTNLVASTDNLTIFGNAWLSAPLNKGQYWVQVAHLEQRGVGKYGISVVSRKVGL